MNVKTKKDQERQFIRYKNYLMALAMEDQSKFDIKGIVEKYQKRDKSS